MLPVHGFVLAGGTSTRMGVDKALLEFCGRPMVEIAVEKLRVFCAEVSIAGNRDDLAKFARVSPERRMDAGPSAGIEAGLKVSRQPWAMFVPVDAPLVPVELLCRWAEQVVQENPGCGASYLLAQGERQPAFCMARKGAAVSVTAALDRGERRVDDVLGAIDNDDKGYLWVVDTGRLMPRSSALQMEYWFSNVNTPQELAEAEAWARSQLR